MSGLTPAQRSLRSQVAANDRWAKAGAAERAAHGQAGQAGLLARFERQVDPDGVLPPEERTRRAENARKAHMARLALASSRARSRRRKGGGDGRAA